MLDKIDCNRFAKPWPTCLAMLARKNYVLDLSAALFSIERGVAILSYISPAPRPLCSHHPNASCRRQGPQTSLNTSKYNLNRFSYSQGAKIEPSPEKTVTNFKYCTRRFTSHWNPAPSKILKKGCTLSNWWCTKCDVKWPAIDRNCGVTCYAMLWSNTGHPLHV